MRYRKGLLPTFLAIALVVAGVWGYNQYREKNYYKDQLVNQYQRMFYDMKDNIETVQTSLSKTLVSTSEESDVLLLSQIYQQAFFAHDKLSQLPVGHQNIAKTEKFLTQVADYSYSMIGRYMKGDKLDDKERQTLFKLQDYTQQLTTELQGAHDKIMKGNLTMFKVRQGQKEEIGDANEDILDTQMQKYEEEQMTDYPELIYDGPFSDQVLNVKPKGLGEGTVDENEAEKIALDFIGVKNPEEINMFNKGESTGSSNIDAYTFSITPKGEESSVIVGVSVKGGKVVWMENPRNVENKKLSDKEALRIAKEFLDKNGYTNMQANYSTKYEDSIVYNFVYEQNGIPIYTDLIKVKVALDNGEVIGVDASNFLKSNHERELLKPKISEKEAKDKIRIGFEIKKVRLAVIPDNGNRDVLCYEFSGTYKGSDFIVYINALDGSQEDILRIIQDENGTLMM
ncbi:germination protein YpeB [Clostridium sp. D2Q-11]|uniref:Germination protein YpeB n=1 Tax=Anaeromonas frigoriresistens TaxID=2683708 RepID=A0A942UYX3_9FIRM|nr:germination protein YpeB [Anaeromonas frigoriresistens]MBS4537017.1 germination protein YpeB [Anaeromonas frigoriresistens]